MWVLFVFSLQPQTENPTWRKFEMMINLTSLTKLPQWWRFLSECLWAVRVPVTESRLIYSVKCWKKKILKSFSIIQIRWAGKDHRRLSCLRCVSLSVHGRNGDGKSGEEFCFIFWGMSSKLLAHSFRSPPPHPCITSISVPTSVSVLWENAVSGKCHICMGETECGGRVGCGGFWEREDL